MIDLSGNLLLIPDLSVMIGVDLLRDNRSWNSFFFKSTILEFCISCVLRSDLNVMDFGNKFCSGWIYPNNDVAVIKSACGIIDVIYFRHVVNKDDRTFCLCIASLLCRDIIAF